MSTADTALSLPIKMAPGPEHRQEPVAPDKSAEDNMEDVPSNCNLEGSATNPEIDNASNVDISVPVDTDQKASDLIIQTASFTSNSESKQEEPDTLSKLNVGQLRSLLDEFMTYKCPKDREGKSDLFKELLQEAEADETEEGRRIISSSRGLTNSNRRRNKRDSVSERLTHGGSLQNLTQPISSEFDSSFGYLTSGCSQTYGGSRRKNKKHTGPSVSARQREGGSLPSNVNASHNLASSANTDLIFEKKSFCEERVTYEWTNKDKSKSLEKSVPALPKKDDKKEKRESSKKDSSFSICESEFEIREQKINKGKYETNEMLESDNISLEDKSDYMLINLSDFEVGAISEQNVSSGMSSVTRACSFDADDEEGTEMRIMEPRRSVKQLIRTPFEIQTPVDTTIEFPIHEHNGRQEKSKMTVNGMDVTTALPFQTNSVKCVISGNSNSANTAQAKLVSNLYPTIPATWPSQNIAMEGPRYSTQQIAMKDTGLAGGEKKSLDENGNAVQGFNSERKKATKKKKETNVIVYKAQDVKGHHYEQDIENQINFIENKDSKVRKGKSNNPVRVKTNSGAKPRAKGKDSKREQLPTKLQKSNSLEEISKTKLEDLVAEKSLSSSGASSVSSQQGTINVALRRAKQRNATEETSEDSRGDRRSWGTEEGQSIYCNDIGDDYSNRRNINSSKKNPDLETEHEFLVVTKKKKSKKQRRSSSGSRAQNLTSSAVYLQRTRGFSNDYNNSLSSELRRKSASSMPPSDKSDSSDLDSVHSLPVTSNTSKHNLTKIPISSEGTPQASYADIARMATINISNSSDSSMSAMGSNILNVASWPTVSNKTTSEPDKLPRDYYPSLDELQQQDRKIKQLSHSNNMSCSLTFSLDKLPSSSVLPKIKSLSERSTTEAQEEAINKNIQVYKYVQDIEKMHQTRSQQQKQQQMSGSFGGNSSNSSSSNNNYNNNNTNDDKCNINANIAPNEQVTNSNQTITKVNNAMPNCNLLESGDNNCITDDAANCISNSKDFNVNTSSRCSTSRSRRNYFHIDQNLQSSLHIDDQTLKKCGKISGEGGNKGLTSSDENCAGDYEEKNCLSSEVPHKDNQNNQIEKIRCSNTNKIQERQGQDGTSDVDVITRIGKNDGQQHQQLKNAKESQCSFNIRKQNEAKVLNCHVENLNPSYEEVTENKSIRVNRSTMASCKRPAVIILDEAVSDLSKSNDLPTELTFGFEINEQLLLSDESEENSSTSPVAAFSAASALTLDKQPHHGFDRTSTVYNKHARHEKHSTSLHYMPSSCSHLSQSPHHPINPVMMQSLPHLNTSSRYHHNNNHNYYHHHQSHRCQNMSSLSSSSLPPLTTASTLPVLATSIAVPSDKSLAETVTAVAKSLSPLPTSTETTEKFQKQSKEDFSRRFIAPEEAINVQNYNHDKIVKFVELAWDAVMREMPGTDAGRIQYYSGQ
ncbi:serine-rich adhesin for platelets-like isoform X2 [Prorops nasuta]|uniref:serine-rich adhesin for platelets-like isoform X2 n=1 Tax=Prorops nasuta TaxID=863751 RepID=UPI0034CEEF64